ncbi:MAG: FtsB family cell division protein [Microbacter sp.]
MGGIFLVVISFFDENNLVKRFENEQKIHHLEDEIDKYRKIVQNNVEKINELKTNNANLEKFARETYGMKRANEDVYIIKEK